MNYFPHLVSRFTRMSSLNNVKWNQSFYTEKQKLNWWVMHPSLTERSYYNSDKTNVWCFLFSEVHDYCAWEDFEASCGPDEVIMTTSAKYGRMSLGRCVKRDYGYLGCSLDVLSYVDAKCSGRRLCSFEVFEDSLRELQPCPSDISSYLEASYLCQKGKKDHARNLNHFNVQPWQIYYSSTVKR